MNDILGVTGVPGRDGEGDVFGAAGSRTVETCPTASDTASSTAVSSTYTAHLRALLRSSSTTLRRGHEPLYPSLPRGRLLGGSGLSPLCRISTAAPRPPPSKSSRCGSDNCEQQAEPRERSGQPTRPRSSRRKRQRPLTRESAHTMGTGQGGGVRGTRELSTVQAQQRGGRRPHDESQKKKKACQPSALHAPLCPPRPPHPTPLPSPAVHRGRWYDARGGTTDTYDCQFSTTARDAISASPAPSTRWIILHTLSSRVLWLSPPNCCTRVRGPPKPNRVAAPPPPPPPLLPPEAPAADGVASE